MHSTLRLLLALACGLAASLTLFAAVTFSGQEPLPLMYISPQPGGRFVSAYSAIAVRQGEDVNRTSLLRAGLFEVVGAQSGRHDGRTLLADDGQTVIFEPALPFAPGEQVAVTLHDGLQTQAGRPIAGVSFQFTVSSMPPRAALMPPALSLIHI